MLAGEGLVQDFDPITAIGVALRVEAITITRSPCPSDERVSLMRLMYDRRLQRTAVRRGAMSHSPINRKATFSGW